MSMYSGRASNTPTALFAPTPVMAKAGATIEVMITPASADIPVNPRIAVSAPNRLGEESAIPVGYAMDI
jgi:hypothetical protein